MSQALGDWGSGAVYSIPKGLMYRLPFVTWQTLRFRLSAVFRARSQSVRARAYSRRAYGRPRFPRAARGVPRGVSGANDGPDQAPCPTLFRR